MVELSVIHHMHLLYILADFQDIRYDCLQGAIIPYTRTQILIE